MTYYLPKDIPGTVPDDITQSRVQRLYRELGGWAPLTHVWHFGGPKNASTVVSLYHPEGIHCPGYPGDCRCMLDE